MSTNNSLYNGDIESQGSMSSVYNKQTGRADVEFNISHYQLGDAKPIGTFSFALTTTVISLINIQARSVTIPNIIVGLGIQQAY